MYYKHRYVIHMRVLAQTLEHGLVLEKIHRCIEFKQSAWMKEYIDFNTRLRTASRNDKISAVDIKENCSKDFKYKSIKFFHDGAEVPPIRVDGNFRVFKFDNKNGPVHSMAINCTGDNESFFRKLNSALANQSCKILKDHTIIPEDFELVKENKYGCSIFAKIYLRKSGKVKCRISRGSCKNLMEIDELVDENFRGSCILKVYQAYIGSSKSISLSVEEILVREVDWKESYFADESDESKEE